MRIALLTQHFAPHFEGGTEFVARAQARALADRGHRVEVLSGTDHPHQGVDVLREEVDGLPVAFLPRRPDEAYDLELARDRLLGLLERELAGVDLVHLHHWTTLPGRTVSHLRRTLGVPVVVSLHDLFVTCPRFFRVPVAPVEHCPEGPGSFEACAACCSPDAPGLPLAELEAGLARRQERFDEELAAASALVFPSRSHLASVSRFTRVPAERVEVVHHGLCARLDPPGPEHGPTALPFTAPPLRVLCLGHRSEVKGVRDLVRAVRGLEGVELLFLGREVEPGFDAALQREAGGGKLTFGGGYAVESLAQRVAELGGAHLAAFPSRVAESYGLVLDEAHALGLPVWVSDRGAPKERVGEAGKVLPAEDSEAWRKAFSSILAQPDTLESARRAVSDASRTADHAARDLEEIYRRLLGGSPPTASPSSGDSR